MKNWFDRVVLSLAREMRLSFLPPLMVYVAAGISGLTAIVGTFFIKDYLGLSAEFLATLGFWAGLPWALKMPVGHLVDLIWRYKGWLVWFGASLIAVSLLIMIGLLAQPDWMKQTMSLERWYVVSALLAPIGYVVQDVVADAMTVEAVPNVDDQGQPIDEATRRSLHVTMQTLGRVAMIGGGLLVAVVNLVMMRGVQNLPEAARLAQYVAVHKLALLIPLSSVLGVVLSWWLMLRRRASLVASGMTKLEALRATSGHGARPPVNWWILGGGLAFMLISVTIGLSDFKFGEELIFAASVSVILFLIWRLTGELSSDARATLIGTAVVIFIFRALPLPGAGASWWMIDVLGFDQQFLSELDLIASVLALIGLFMFRKFMSDRSIYSVVVILTIVGALLQLPTLGMAHGLHHWTAAHTGGVVDARFIAILNTAAESPLGQVAMVPMLAWIANSAPEKLKATYFAVMASFTNLALSASQLFTKYLNQVFVVTREVKDPAGGAVTTAANYSQLPELLLWVLLIGLIVPLVAVALVRVLRLRSA